VPRIDRRIGRPDVVVAGTECHRTPNRLTQAGEERRMVATDFGAALILGFGEIARHHEHVQPGRGNRPLDEFADQFGHPRIDAVVKI